MVFPTNRGGDDFPWRLYAARSVQASRYRRRPHAHSTARFLRPKGRCSDERTVKCGTKGPPRILPLLNADLAGSASWRLCEILEVRECGRSISAQSQGFDLRSASRKGTVLKPSAALKKLCLPPSVSAILSSDRAVCALGDALLRCPLVW